jgi:hypothetical protein
MLINKELEALQQKGYDVIKEIIETLKEKTKENPLVIFTDEQASEDDNEMIYDLPYGYTTSRDGYYLQGAIQKVQGNDVTIFFTGDNWGETYQSDLDELPFYSLVQLLSFLDRQQS